MHRSAPLLAALLATTAACTSVPDGGGGQAAADLVLTNGRVYTVDAAHPWADAVAVDDGRIVAVGTAAQMAGLTGPDTQVTDLGGRLVLPGFGDTHVHPVFGGMAYTRCSLHDGTSVADYQRIIQSCVDRHPGATTVYGVGWEDSVFPPNGIPTKDVLDAVSTSRALIFESVGGHTYWVNSMALANAGITKDTPDPVNGTINRDPAGEPVGALQETAMRLVDNQVPKPNAQELQASIRYVATEFNQLGITNWLDAGVPQEVRGWSATLDAYQAVQQAGDLTSRVAIAIRWDNDRGVEQVPDLLAAIRRGDAAGLRINSVKFYLDGVIPQQTAAMIEPYAGATARGTLQIDPAVLAAGITALGKEGIQPYVHAIGDRAVRTALDAFAAAEQANGSLERPMITHMNVVDPADQPRFGHLGAIAQFQPTWTGNYPYMDLTKQAIGPERSGNIYPTGRILRAGGMVAFGADWPVDTADPIKGLQVALTRTSFGMPDSAPLLPGDALTLEQAIRAHTLDAAYAMEMDGETGSITVGKSADLVVLSQDIFTLAPERIDDADVLLTLFRGRPVFGTLDQFSVK